MNLQNRGRKAFSLVEILITVAIIGIMVAIARPMYAKYRGRAVQTTAKLELSQGFAFESAFFAAYNTYHGNLCYLGWIPESIIMSAGTASVRPGFKRYYGYMSGGSTNAWAGRGNTNVPLPQLAGPPDCFGAAFSSNCYPANGAYFSNCAWSAEIDEQSATNTFTHNIMGSIKSVGGWGGVDCWKINQDGRLWQVRDGL